MRRRSWGHLMRTQTCIAALAAVALLGLASSASAADLGGDCCADLEERIAELEATTARKGNRKVSLTVYGSVNQAVLFWDDATERNTYVVNNKTATTHFGFEGSATIDAEWRAGYLIEIEAGSANSDFVDQGQITTGAGGVVLGFNDDSQRLNVRHSNWWLENKRVGRVTVGQQSNATDNIAEMDLSRTSAVSLSSVETWNEGFFLRSANDSLGVLVPGLVFVGTSGTAQFSIMGDLWRGNLDGGRGNFVRYDSPVLAGFIFSASWGEDDDYAVALRYAGSFNGVSVKAGIGYQNGKTIDSDALPALLPNGTNGIPDHEDYVGSFSLLHEPTGLFLTMAGGMRHWTESPFPVAELLDEKYIYVKGGILRKWLPLGQTAIYGEYYRIWDNGIAINSGPFLAFDQSLFNETAETIGVGVVQHIDAAAMELYVSYRHYWADDITDLLTITDHDIRFDAVMTGARIKF